MTNYDKSLILQEPDYDMIKNLISIMNLYNLNDEELLSAMIICVQNGCYEGLIMCLSKIQYLSKQSFCNLLLLSSKRGNPCILIVLLNVLDNWYKDCSKYEYLNVVDKNGNTILMNSAIRGHKRYCKLVYGLGCINKTIKNNKVETINDYISRIFVYPSSIKTDYYINVNLLHKYNISYTIHKINQWMSDNKLLLVERLIKDDYMITFKRKTKFKRYYVKHYCRSCCLKDMKYDVLSEEMICKNVECKCAKKYEWKKSNIHQEHMNLINYIRRFGVLEKPDYGYVKIVL